MNEVQLKHILSAAARIGDDNEIIVIGSQSILGQFPEASKNPVLSYSMEADIYLKNKPANTILVEGSIGEGSLFHQTFGYYAQEVGPNTAILPKGWEERLFPVHVYNNKIKVTGYCLESHDLAVAKYAAGRQKDYGFIAVMVNRGMLRKRELISRVYMTSGIDHVSIVERIKRDFKAYASHPVDIGKIVASPAGTELPKDDAKRKAFVEMVKSKRKIR